MTTFTVPYAATVDSSRRALVQIVPDAAQRIQIVEFHVSFKGVTAINTPCLIELGTASEDSNMDEVTPKGRLTGALPNASARTFVEDGFLVDEIVTDSFYTDPNGKFHMKFNSGPVILGSGTNTWTLMASSPTVPLPASGFVSFKTF
jgi:hypothetical protein